MKKIKIGFRVDTGNIIGAGHLTEVISIYQHLKKKLDFYPIFITAENNFIRKKLNEIGVKKIYPIIKNIPPENLNEKRDMYLTLSMLKKHKCDYLIIDLPNRTRNYYKYFYNNLKGSYTILDNDKHQKIASTLVVNFSITQDFSYYENLENSIYLIGPKYIPLNECILERKPIKIKKNIKRIFVNQGGSDPYGLTIKVVKALEKLNQNYMVDLVVGGLVKDSYKKTIKDLIENKKRYNLYENIPQQKVYEIMENTDISITAAGNTLYELAYFGIPSIMIAPRKEFLKITESFEKLGNINLGVKNFIDEEIIIKKLQFLIRNFNLRKKISSNLKRLVDGKGCRRICDCIIRTIT